MGGSSTTTIAAPEPSAEELALLQQEVALATQQLAQLEQFGAFQEQAFAANLPLLQQQATTQALALELQKEQFEATRPLIGQQADLQQQLLALQERQFAAQEPLVQRQADVQAAQFALQQQQFEQQAPLSALQAQLFQSQLEDQLARSAALGTPQEQAQRQALLQDLELQQLQTTMSGAEQAQRLLPLQEELANLQIEAMRRVGEGPSAEQLAHLEELGQAQIAAGDIDITRFERQGMEALREELAPSLGLSGRDTPILDRASRVAAEATRQRGQLMQNVRVAQLGAQQNLPLAQAQIIGAGTTSARQIGQATQEFQSRLQGAAIQNRLQLGTGFPAGGAGGFGQPQTGLGFTTAGQTIAGLPGIPTAGASIAGATQSGLGLLSAGRTSPGGIALGLGQQRLAQASTTTTQNPGLLDIAGAAGGFMVGIGAVTGSDIRLKSNVHLVESTWDEVVDLSGLVSDYDMQGMAQTGLVAQDLEQNHGELVVKLEGDIKGVLYQSIFAKVLKALGEALGRIEDLESNFSSVKEMVMP